MFTGRLNFYLSYFSSQDRARSKSVISLKDLGSWYHIDTSFNDYFLNLFDAGVCIYPVLGLEGHTQQQLCRDDLSNVVFTVDTGLSGDESLEGFSYLNVQKFSLSFSDKDLDGVRELVEATKNEIFAYVEKLGIEEFVGRDHGIRKELVNQKLKIQLVMASTDAAGSEKRKFQLLDLATSRPEGTSEKILQRGTKIPHTHSAVYLNEMLATSLVDIYQEWTGLITTKYWITIFDANEGEPSSDLNTFNNHSVGFGLIYIHQIYLLEYTNTLNTWVNENRFSSELGLYKKYFQFIKKFDFNNISTKQLYNFYYKKLHDVFQIREELELIKNKIKEIELLHEKESSALTNSLLLIIALLQIPAVFLDDIQALLARSFGWSKEPVAAVLLALGVMVAALLFWRVNRRKLL